MKNTPKTIFTQASKTSAHSTDESFCEPVTDFGYETIPKRLKTQKVNAVFGSVAPKYDLMNDLMSAGIHRFWKNYTVNLAHVRPGQQVLDLAGGTGDLAILLANKVGKTGQVILVDINTHMLQMGRDRLLNAGYAHRVCFIQANAENLPFIDNQFDLITISFGLRNITDKMQALQSMLRVLKPGGKLLILEFSKPVSPLLSRVYDAYSFYILPKLGQLVAGDAHSYRYLAESIRQHPDQDTLKHKMLEVGFKSCDYHNLTGGVVAIHRGYKD